ncbi:MAG: hypothetical protein GF383_02855, partial [Candidatus Lokiarchaeota archaeon]|nr:hypothetical protein [Candidatus Lokiarchaeota archaeon]MBD3338454.1 hypothetical protein [Candidatus Lokiarchaeota archaeon]
MCPYCGQDLETPDSTEPLQLNDKRTETRNGLNSRTELPVGQNIAGVSNTRSVHLQMKMFVVRKIYEILKKSRQSPELRHQLVLRDDQAGRLSKRVRKLLLKAPLPERWVNQMPVNKQHFLQYYKQYLNFLRDKDYFWVKLY